VAGATGVTGPIFSNSFSSDPTVHSGSFTIPDNATSVTFVTGAATITLPHASSVVGKKIWIVTVTPGTSFTIQRQGTDVIFRSGSGSEPYNGETSFTNSFPVEMFTDGSKWYLTFAGA
jgi:hypothetical protein